MIFNWRRREGEAGRNTGETARSKRSDAAPPQPAVSQPTGPTPADRPSTTESLAPLPYERACCCGAQPRVRVLLLKHDAAANGDSDPRDDFVDLLLCDHHYREAAGRLSGMGAIAIGTDGRPMSDAVPAVVRVPAAPLRG